MKNALIVFWLTLLAYLLTAGGHLYSPDEEILFRTTRALALGEGLAIEPMGPGGFATSPGNPPRADGKEYAQYGIGQPLLAVPFYWIGRLAADALDTNGWLRLYPAFSLGFDPRPEELAPRWALSWFNIFVGAFLALALYRLCLEWCDQEKAALLAALLYALGSMAWAHSRPFFTEPLATLAIVLAWWALLRARRDNIKRWCALAGLAAGYAALVRADSVLAYPGLACLLLGPIVSSAREQGRTWWGAWLAFCLPALCCGLVLLGLNWLRHGGPFATGYEDQPEGVAFSTPLLAGLYGYLFSAGKGLFFFSPALALSFLGWRCLGRNEKNRGWLCWGLGLAIAVPLLMHAKWQNWAGGWCWGPRHIFMIHAFLAVPIAAWLAVAWGPATRVVIAVAFVVGGAVQLFGSSQDFILFHYQFFRSPGSRAAFFVQYDDHDRAYWDQYYQLYFKPPAAAGGQTESFAVLLFPPAPIQSSLYHPQHTAWQGYKLMLQAGMADNFWLNLLRSSATANEPQRDRDLPNETEATGQP